MNPPNSLTTLLRGMYVLFGFTAYGHSYPSVSEETLKEKHANLTGMTIDVSLHKEKEFGCSCQSYESACQDIGNYNETSLASTDTNYMSARRGMIFPFAPLSLTFDGIRYSVDVPQVSFI